MTVVIHIGDVNDNRPLFSNQSYSFAIVENAGTGSIVDQVKATDADQVSNRGTLSYVGGKCPPSVITCRVLKFFFASTRTFGPFGRKRAENNLNKSS